MIDKQMIENYEKSLEQRYNAICFDIDGTLTEKNSKNIDKRVIEMLATLLKRKIPLVFITGRGETGLNDLKNDIYIPLKCNFGINNKELSRIYVLTNDGARLFMTTKNNLDDILNTNVYTFPIEQLNELKCINDNIIEKTHQKYLHKLCDIKYSIDKKNNNIINIRIILNKNDEKLISILTDIIKDTIKDNYLNNVCVSRGIYKGKNVIQIGNARKDLAIEQAEKIIGIPQKSMLRIGDCGDIRGNDYTMLNCEQGFSVDKINGSNNCCFPIIDGQGKIIKGIEGTLYLIKKAKIIPTVCLESMSKEDYSHRYARMEEQIVKGVNGHLKKYNDIINKKFHLINGINDIFDEFSGSVKIPMYEWELIENNALKDFWNTRKNNNLCYSLRDDNNYILRGSKTYYYFLANRQSIDKKDFTTSKDVIEWYENYLCFLKNAIFAIKNTENLKKLTNKKMILGLVDNARNIILIIINHRLVSKYSDKNVLLNLNCADNIDFYSLYRLLYLIEEIMYKICFVQNYSINKEIILEILTITYQELYNDYTKTQPLLTEKNYSKEYRAYREIDNFAENYITVKMNNQKNILNKNFAVCGMAYGGIELPILYKIINKSIEDVLLLKFSNSVCGYTNKQLVELRKFNINKYGGLQKIGTINTYDIVLQDDNILTGKTMQLALNTLYDEKYNISNINIVRYPSINRVNQMFINNSAAVDYNLFFDYITGLCFHSPYSWRDENEYDIYEDTLGVFDLNRKKITECLIKNHDFKKTSEVAAYKRRIIR